MVPLDGQNVFVTTGFSLYPSLSRINSVRYPFYKRLEVIYMAFLITIWLHCELCIESYRVEIKHDFCRA